MIGGGNPIENKKEASGGEHGRSDAAHGRTH